MKEMIRKPSFGHQVTLLFKKKKKKKEEEEEDKKYMLMFLRSDQ